MSVFLPWSDEHRTEFSEMARLGLCSQTPGALGPKLQVFFLRHPKLPAFDPEKQFGRLDNPTK